MDLSALAIAADGVEMKLRHPGTNEVLKNDDGSDMTITLSAGDSEKVRKAQREKINRRLKNARNVTAESIDDDAVDLLATATVKWNLTIDGKQPECTTEAVRKLYTDPRIPWLRKQVDEFVGDVANFIRA